MDRITDELGSGLKETVYQNALAVESRFQGYKVDLELNKSILYHGSQARPHGQCHHVGTVRQDMIIDVNYSVEFKALTKLTKKEFT
jgi:GxxExxY protein